MKTKTDEDWRIEREQEDIFYAGNPVIGKFLGFEPKIEYCVGQGTGICYSPSQMYGSYLDSKSQKSESERWLKRQKEEYPDSHYSNYEVMKLEYYPFFHQDWSSLMNAVDRLKEKGVTIMLSTDIKSVWESVYKACKS